MANHDLLNTIAIAVVMMLTGFALQALKNVVTRLWATVRVLFAALFAIVLASGALTLTAGILVMRIHAS
jgi:hypothetical protein